MGGAWEGEGVEGGCLLLCVKWGGEEVEEVEGGQWEGTRSNSCD